MKVTKSLLLGAAAGLTTVSVAQAADLPTRKAAPINYVRVCDAYGAGFFYIPGTETCLRVGGTVLAQLRIQGSPDMWSMPTNYAGAPIMPQNAYGLVSPGIVPPATSLRPGNGLGRDSTGFDAVGRIELDSRTQTGWGTLRTFLRLQSSFGSGVNSTTGSYTALVQAATPVWNGITPSVAKDFAYLDKAFIQFAGVTMGRVQSFFDFYIDNYNYEALRTSNQNVWALAYTGTFANGVSASISVEDPTSHRAPVTSAVSAQGFGIGTYTGASGYAPSAIGAVPQATRVPDIVGNIRVDQAWGAVQIMGAIHDVRAALYTNGINNAMPLNAATPLSTTDKFGFAVGAGLQYKLDNIAPGDVLWLQAIYARGSIGYTSGNNMAFTTGPNTSSTYGQGLVRVSNSHGYFNGTDYDCVFAYNGQCELSESYAITGAFKHYWAPTLSSALFGSYYAVHYSKNVLTPVGSSPIGGLNGNTYTGLMGMVGSGGVNNYKEIRIGANLVWTPVKGFDIGGEIAWIRGMATRPFGLAQDNVLRAAGLPAYKGTNDAFHGKLRMIRAF